MAQHIKHPPPDFVHDHKSRLLFRYNSPVVPALKRVDKALEKAPTVTLCGLGKAIDRTLVIGLKLQNAGHRIDVTTGTVSVLDEFDDGQNEPKTSTRLTSKVEIVVHRK